MKKYAIIQETRVNETLKIFINKHLKTFNNHHSPFHLLTRNPENVQHLSLGVYSEKEELVGGVICRLYWHWLEIEDIFINEEFPAARV